MTPAHRRGNYRTRADALRRAATADATTRCWRCGRTLAEHPPHQTGRPATWHAGHVNDGEVGGALLPEASTCNVDAGARLGAARRWTLRTTRTW